MWLGHFVILLRGNQPEAHERTPGGLLLCLSFAHSLAAGNLLAIPDDDEGPTRLMIRPRRTRFAVKRQRQPTRLSLFLKRGLRIRKSQGPIVEGLEILRELFTNELEGRFPTTVNGNGPDQRFEKVLEERRSFAASRPLFTRPDLDPPLESKQRRALGEPLGSDEVYPLTGESALIILRKELEKEQRRGVTENCVAEKLESLVGPVLLRGNR